MYYVFVPGTRDPREVYDTGSYSTALEEAKRLAQITGKEAMVCQIISVASAHVKVESPNQWKQRHTTGKEELMVPLSEIMNLLAEIRSKKKKGRPRKTKIEPLPSPVAEDDEVPF